MRLRAYFTPGHTPEHLSYLLFDPSSGERPVALFSGDALFVGDVGRPDLLGEGATRGLAEQLQAQAFRDVPYVPLGQQFQQTAYRAELSGILPGMPVFWNVARA